MRTFYKIMVLIMAVLPIVSQAQNNITYRESFEQEECGWTFSPSEGNIIESGFLPTESYRLPPDGTKCLKFPSSSEKYMFSDTITSPSIKLEANQTYYISFLYNGYEKGGLKLTVNQKGEYLSNQTNLYDSKNIYLTLNCRSNKYKKVIAEYTPKEAGEYQFSITNSTSYFSWDNLYIDLFSIKTTIEDITLGATSIRGGLWDISDPNEERLFITPGSEIEIQQEVKNAVSFAYKQQDTPLPLAFITEEKVSTSVTSFKVGENTIQLISSNKNQEVEKEISIDAIYPESKKRYILSAITNTEELNALSTSGPYYACNSWYHKAAEKYEMSPNLTFSVSGFIFKAISYGDKNFNIKIDVIACSQTPDTTLGEVLESYETTKNNLIAHPLTDRGDYFFQFNFPESTTVTGSFYIQLTFPEFVSSEVTRSNCINFMGTERDTYRYLSHPETDEKYSTSFKFLEETQKWVPFKNFSAYIAPIVTIIKETDAISDTEAIKTPVSTSYYNLSGMPLAKEKINGFYLKKTIYSDGSSKTEKGIQ